MIKQSDSRVLCACARARAGRRAGGRACVRVYIVCVCVCMCDYLAIISLKLLSGAIRTSVSVSVDTYLLVYLSWL